MADEPITTTVTTTESPVTTTTVNPVEARITDLSSKVRETSTQRDEALARAEAAEKKAAFAEGFADIVVTNPAAKEHKADIEAKVASGYTLQDATYAVLGAAGKLGAPQVERMPIGGGSANTPITVQPTKTVDTMTREEKRAELMDAERKGFFSLQ